jgi:hypothetical protein
MLRQNGTYPGERPQASKPLAGAGSVRVTETRALPAAPVKTTVDGPVNPVNETVDVAKCRYAPKHTGCSQYGHDFKVGGSPSLKPCPGHSAPIKVFDGPVPVWAGGSNTAWPKDDPRPGKVGVVLNLADLYRPEISVHLPGQPPEYPRLDFDWRDFGTPRVSVNTWGWIAAEVRRYGGAVVRCQMGHGRTGTALAILGVFLGAIPADADPVTYVREHYCPRAVESQEQRSYVEKMTGRKVSAAPSGHSGASWQPKTPGTTSDKEWWTTGPRDGMVTYGD